jgi:hypothetical protein
VGEQQVPLGEDGVFQLPLPASARNTSVRVMFAIVGGFCPQFCGFQKEQIALEQRAESGRAFSFGKKKKKSTSKLC